MRAGNAGVTLDASHITVQGNYIGLLANGKTAAGNRGDGMRINASSHGDLIGQVDPVTGVTYYNANAVSMQPVSGWQGIRDADTPGQYLITGTSDANGLLYDGPISGVGGTSYAVNYPGAHVHERLRPRQPRQRRTSCGWSAATSDQRRRRPRLPLPGDDRRPLERRQLPDDRLSRRDVHLRPQHDGRPRGRQRRRPGGELHRSARATRSSTTSPQARSCPTSSIPGSTTTTAYGIWYNGGTSYTIAGGYTTPGERRPADRPGLPGRLRLGDRAIHPLDVVRLPERAGRRRTSSPTSRASAAPRRASTRSLPTRSRPASSTPLQGSSVTVRRNPDGTFGPAAWVDLNYPGATGHHQHQLRGRQPGRRHRRSARGHHSRTRRRSTSGSSSPTSSAATAATASGSTGPTTTRSP